MGSNACDGIDGLEGSVGQGDRRHRESPWHPQGVSHIGVGLSKAPGVHILDAKSHAHMSCCLECPTLWLTRRVGVLVLLATIGSCSDQSTLGEDIARVDVTPANLALTQGEDSVVNAEVRSTEGALLPDRRVYWASSATAVATVSAVGIVSAIAPGTARIAASAGGKSGLVQVTVAAPPISVVRVTPSTSGVGVGASLTLRADALEASGDTIQGRPITWRSSSAAVASVNALGTVQGMTPGTVSITATVAGVTGTAVIAVQALAVARVTVAPATASMLVGRSVPFTATLRAADNAVITGRFVSWTSSAPAVASVSSTGVVIGLAPGTATITATSEGRTATATVTVIPVPVASVSVVPNTLTLGVSKTAPLIALPADSAGGLLGGRAATWVTSAATIATVSSAGVVTGVAPGTARITATVEGKSANATVTVTTVPVARVTITPPTISINRGQTFQLTAATFDAAGVALTGRVVTWLSGSATIARVTAQGLVTGLARGSVLIFAESEGQRASATITVQ